MAPYTFNPMRKEGPKKTPIGGFGERLANMGRNNYRGLIGSIVPICFVIPQVERFNVALKHQLMWMTMAWFFLLQPVDIVTTAVVPVFAMPMAGIMSAALTCKAYMNESILLFILSGWLLVLLNNSGVDKRIALWFICSGDASQYTGRQMVFKCSSAAFFLSIFSNRLIASYSLTKTVTNAYGKLAGSAKSGGSDFNGMRNVVNNAIQTSCGIGGIAIIHSSSVNLLFRGCFQELSPPNYQHVDVFNYLQYSAFAFPIAFAMFIINVFYHMSLVDKESKVKMSEAHTTELKRLIERENATIPPDVSLHEMYSVFFTLLYLIVSFFRWNLYMSGWGEFSKDELEPRILGCKDVTTAAIFCVILHMIPKSFNFMNIWSVKKKSTMGTLKPESGILWWRFIDKNVNYSFMFLIGSSFAIMHGSRNTDLDHVISAHVGRSITGFSWNVGILLCVAVATILSNVMAPLSACAIWVPFVLLSSIDAVDPWPTKVYIAALGSGVACNFGFCGSFNYGPGYYCHHIGKVPLMQMIKFSIPTVIICSVILYLALILYAPFLFDPDGEGFIPVLPKIGMKTPVTTTEATTIG